MTHLQMHHALVVVACSAKARFLYFLDEDKRLMERSCLVNAKAQAHERELVTDRPGSDFDAAGSGRHGVSSTHAKDDYAKVFASQVATEINRDIADKQARKLIVVAAPRFLGLLRKQLSKQSLAACQAQISKDLTHLSEDEILAQIEKEGRRDTQRV